MTTAATKFIASLPSASLDGLIDREGITDAGVRVLNRLCEETGESKTTATVEVNFYWLDIIAKSREPK